MAERGGGRGLVATEVMTPGDLVLVSRPMGYVSSDFGTLPDAEVLVASINSSDLSAAQRAVLLELHAGDEFAAVSGESEAQDDPDEGGDVQGGDLTDERLYGIIGCNSFGEEFTDFASSLARAPPPPPPQQQQLPAGAGAGAGAGAAGGPVQVGHLGLWPSFSMLNHSCCPNAVNYVVGDSMCVFAADHVEQGSELLINYLGAASLRPVEERQAGLAEAYAFSCACPRCSLELLHGCSSSSSSSGSSSRSGGGSGGPVSVSVSVSDELQALLERCADRAAELDDAVAGGPTSSAASGQLAVLTELGARAAADLAAAEQLLTPAPELLQQQAQQASPARAAQWLRAAAYELYSQHTALAEAAARCAEAAEAQAATAAKEEVAAAASSSGAAELTEWLWAGAAGALESQLGVVAAVAPHSDLHLFLATKALALAQAAEGRARARARTGAQTAATGQGQQGGGAAGAGAGGVVGSAAALARCCAVVRGRYGRRLSDGTVQRLLEGAAWGLSQVAV